jgi:pimeloyl-ACP methyl ester carboxylesterase
MAYADPDGVVVIGDTMYISGTGGGGHWLRDAIDDVKIPFHMVHHSARYVEAMTKLNHKVKHLVGHSLGGAVASRLTEDFNHLDARVYGAPLMRVHENPRVKSFRHYGDPVSMFDRSSEMYTPGLNPHSYDGY